MGKLTASKVKSITAKGKHGDGGGLFLYVANGGSKSWVHRLSINGKRRDMGLGGYPKVGLAKARELADANRVDAMGLRTPTPALNFTNAPTLETAAVKCFDAKVASGQLTNAKHSANWLQVLRRHVFPTIGETPVDRIDQTQLKTMLEELAINQGLAETALRCRGRISEILKDCIEDGHINENAADKLESSVKRWGQRRKTNSKHFKAVGYEEVAGVLGTIRHSNGMKSVRLALEFAIFTAARSGEVRGARWGEVDLATATWTIPASRMKAGVEHRVPLSLQARLVLQEAKTLKGRTENDLVFPHTGGRELSQSCLPLRCKKLGLKTTPHGFRSSFRGWAAEHEVGSWAAIEKCLAHKVGTDVEQAYFRVDMLAQRVRIMDAWGDYLDPAPF